jgi:hypothetical protein
MSASEAGEKCVRPVSEISMAESGHDWQCITRFDAALFRRKQSQWHVSGLADERLHGDDTSVPVLAKGKTDTGRI